MKITISESLEDSAWDDYLSHNAFAHHEQTSQYGKIRTEYGFKNFRLIARESDRIIGGMQVLVRSFPYGKLAFVSQGPIVDLDRFDVIENLVKALDREAINRKLAKVRFSNYENQSYYESILLKYGYEPSQFSWCDNETSVVDLSDDTDTIFNHMHRKVRYNIRQASKKELVVDIGERDNIREFYCQLKDTSCVKKFPILPFDYFQYLWDLLAAQQKMLLFLARYNGKAIAGLIVTRIGDTAYYGWGGASREYPTLKASTFLQWHAIQKAKEEGCQRYDLGGVSYNNADSVSRFKLQFSGKQVIYPDPLDKYYGRIPGIRKSISHIGWNTSWLRNKINSTENRFSRPLPY